MSDQVRVWLVERSYSDKGLVTVVYATPDGTRRYSRQLSEHALARSPVTAAQTVEADSLAGVTDDETRERYAAEATRMASAHDPGDEV